MIDQFHAINGDRLLQRLHQLAQMGGLPEGGVCRLAFSPEDIQGRAQVAEWMIQAGMQVRTDAAGNLIGRYAGEDPAGEDPAGEDPECGAIATGSHLDTVPVGGKYDGALGVIAGIECVQTLHEQGKRLRHPIEVIAFTDEESSMIGCKAIAGTMNPDPQAYHRTDGRSIQDCLAAIGGDWAEIATARRDRTQIAAFLELHVEQGGVLEHETIPIGIVTGIVGQRRYRVTVLGCANHAGTTPMNLRQDALVAASQIVLAAQQIAIASPGNPVMTVGSLTVTPNAPNIVPGQVDLTIDLRDLSSDRLQHLFHQLQATITDIARSTHTQIAIQPILQIQPTLASDRIQAVLAELCHAQGIPAFSLPSRAGHDAQEIGRITEMGMIFVPSQGGLSHSAQEHTNPEDCVLGANLLFHAIAQLDAPGEIEPDRLIP